MADLSVAAVLGPADRNSGSPRYADVVAHLYIGGSGVWQLHRLGTPSSEELTMRPVRVLSIGEPATELAAGLALVTGVGSALTRVEERLGRPWAGEENDLDARTLRELAGLVTELDVAMVVTSLATDAAHVDALLKLPWSVVVATPSAESRSTQWN